jgi:hypothetical protein
MAQVNPENSTPMPVVQSRRRFLSTAAGIAAGSTALALTIPPARAAGDPVFALIEKHRAANAALEAACHAEDGQDAAHEVEMSALADLLECIPTTIGGS